jgi:hypothetical protein
VDPERAIKTETNKITHDELVARASKWLANTMKCSVVITEMSGHHEEPDAIGWGSGGHSILVECKTSKSDFDRDMWKAGRRTPPRWGVGNRRYYLVPPELVDYVLENRPYGWGVLVAHKTRVNIKDDGEYFSEAYKLREIGYLVSALRRLAGEKHPIKGANIKFYTINENKNPKATIGIEL